MVRLTSIADLRGLLVRRAQARALLGDVEAAQADLRRVATRGPTGPARIVWAGLLLRLGRLASARRMLGRRPKSDYLGARWDLVVAELAHLEAELDEARRRLRSARGYAEREGLVALELHADVIDSRLARRRGDVDTAREAASRAIEGARRGGYGRWLVDAQLALARVDPARIDVREAVEGARRYDYAWALGDGLHLAAERAREGGEPGLSRQLAEEAVAVRRRIHDPKLGNTLSLLRR